MASTLQHSAQNELMSALSTLHLGGKYSDLTITCNDRQWAVHKAILCSRSGFFDSAGSNRFREASTGIIDLSEDDESAVEQMIHYFYHLDYCNEPEREASAVFRHRLLSDARRRLSKKVDLSQIQDPLLAQAGCYAPEPAPEPIAIDTNVARAGTKSPRTPRSPVKTRQQTPPLEASNGSDYESYDEGDVVGEEESHLLLHTRVYSLAEKYDIPSLKALAQRKFEMAMACYYDSSEFAEAIEEVYCSTIDSDRGLRDVVLQAFRSHPALATTQDVYGVIKETPTLAFELFKIERGLPVS